MSFAFIFSGGPVTIVWSMAAAAVLTLGLIYMVICWRQRYMLSGFVFLILSLSVVAMAGMELGMMRAPSVADYLAFQRWYHVPIWLTFVALAWFAPSYFAHGHNGFLYGAVALRTLSLILHVYFPQGINFRHVDHLHEIRMLGDIVMVAHGTTNPWILVAQLSFLLVFMYGVHVALASWWNNDRRIVVAMAICLAVLVAGGLLQTVLIFWVSMELPMMASVLYFLLIIVMGAGLIDDVVKSRRFSIALDRERNMIASVFDNAPGLMAIWRPDGYMVRWSRMVAQTTGLSPEQIRQRHALDWVAGDDRGRLAAAMEKAYREGYAEDRFDICTADGHTIPLLLSGVPVLVDNQPHLVSFGIDLRDINRLEGEVARQQRVLAQANRLSLMSSIASSITHEINQPLTASLANAECSHRLLGQDPLPIDQIRVCISDIIAETIRAGKIINNLRSFITHSPATSEVINLNDLIASVVPLVLREARLRSIQLATLLAPYEVTIHGDAIQIKQLILNLLLHGLDGVEPGPDDQRTVHVSTRKDANRVIRLHVRYRSRPIPGELMPSLFEPIGPSARNEPLTSLPICRLIAEKHGGKICADYEPGTQIFSMIVDFFSPIS